MAPPTALPPHGCGRGVVVDDVALAAPLQIEGVFELGLAAGTAVRRAALEAPNVPRRHGAVEGDEHDEVRVVPRVIVGLK